MNCKELKKFGNRKHQKTWPVTLFRPLAAILNFPQKCKKTAVSQKLSMLKKFVYIFFASMRCLNYWDNKKYWGAKSGPPSPATSVKLPRLIVAWKKFHHCLKKASLKTTYLSDLVIDHVFFVWKISKQKETKPLHNSSR